MNDSVLTYEGLKRPLELLRVLDGPSSKGKHSGDEKPEADDSEDTLHKRKILEQYFHDLYGIFMKRLSCFIVES